MFTDKVQVQLKAGKGGNGIVTWRREKYIPKGGPTGGNGGRGGSIYIEADPHYYTLDWYRNRKHLTAENGRIGGSNQKQGRKGKDLVLKVPCGTLVKNVETEEVLGDLIEPNQKILLCEGGRGGRGNASFKTPTNRAPNYCTEGKPGESLGVDLELKLIADIGLVGFPNAGKSSLMNTLTRVEVKRAAYPFTTLKPNLGFFVLPDQTRLFLADIPGIIEGAHRNRGLGIEFLRHIERTKVLLFVLDASGIDGRDPLSDYRILRSEIEAYNPELLEKPFFVALNKVDDEESEKHLQTFKREAEVKPENLFEISALRGDGLKELTEALIRLELKC